MAADKHTIKIVDKDGNQSEVTLPGFALDMTQERLIKSVQALGKMNPKTAKAYEDLINETKSAVTATEDASSQQKKDAKALQDTVQTVGDKQVSALRQFQANFADRVGKDMRDTFTSGGNILTAAIKTATVGLAAGAGLLYKTFMDTSEAFRSLAQAGLGGAGASGTEAQDAVANLTRLGMSASEAAGLITSFGQASTMLGKANFSKFVSGVANAGSFASDLGLTLEEAAEYAAEEIDIRQRALIGRVQLDGQQSQSVMDAIRQTQLLAGIMGKSMKDINQDKKEFVDNNANIASVLNSMPQQYRAAFMEQMTVFGGASAQLGDNAGKLLQSVVNASMLAVPIQDANLQQLAALGPAGMALVDLANQTNKTIRSGNQFTAEEQQAVIKRFSSIVSNMNESEQQILNTLFGSGNAAAGNFLNASVDVAKYSENVLKSYNKQAAALDPMVTAAANLQNALNRISGVFTTVRNQVLGQFAEPLNRVLDQFSMSGNQLVEHNAARKKAIENNKEITDAEKTQQLAALEKTMRTKSLIETLSAGLEKISKTFMDKFFPSINSAGDGVSSFVDIVVIKVEEILTGIDNFINSLDGDTFGEKLADAAKKLFALALPGIIYVLTETAKAVFSSDAVKNALVLGIGLLFGASVVKSAILAAASGFFKFAMSRLALPALAAPAVTAATSAGTAGTAAAAGAGVGLLAKAKSYGGAFGNTLKALPSAGLAGKAITGASGIGAGLMIGKDAFDIGSSLYNGESVKGADIGGVAGGVLGGVAGAFLGGPVGAALGASLGNMAGEWVGSFFDKDDAAQQGQDIAKQTKEELLQQNGLVAMAIDPEHVKEVGRALAFFNAISVANIAAGLAVLNPVLAQMFETIQNIRTAFVDNVNNRLQRLLTIITGLNVEGLKLPTTIEHLGSLAAQITSMPIDKINKLSTAFSALTIALRDFTNLTSSNFFTRAFDAFTGKQDDTESIIKVLNNFADKVDSEKLLKAAQATMAFNAGLSGYAAVPAETARTSPTGQKSPADQVNTAANMRYDNPMLKFDSMISELASINEKFSEGGVVIRTLRNIKVSTADTAKKV
jgi:hypothetical protein